MPQDSGLYSPVAIDRPFGHVVTMPHAITKHTDPASPQIDVSLQLLQQKALISSKLQNPDFVTKNIRRLDRSVSEPYGPHSQQNSKNVLNPNRYKTEMCRPFNENGYCKYGDKCQFAHGSRDQRSVPRHPKYKTEYCKTFHTTGICPYGPRCHFIHNEDELKLGEITKMKQHQATIQAAQEMAKQAAQIQVQHQLIQHQLHSLVTQVNAQLMTQISTPQSSPDAQAVPMGRPRFKHSISLNPSVFRGYLGSTADTPPESNNTSPIHSPLYALSEDSVSEASEVSSTFSFPSGNNSPLQMSPQKRNVSPPHISNNTDNLTSLSNSINALLIGQNGNVEQPNISCPFSPTSASRLPVFSKIAES